MLGYHDAENTSQTVSEAAIAQRNPIPTGAAALLPGYTKSLFSFVSQHQGTHYFSVGDSGFLVALSAIDALEKLKTDAEQAIAQAQPFISIVTDNFYYGE
ncbi:hypothetical protein AB3R30_13345 [Leptolyngbyaceae cyanobacterium UHCC 1019]